MEQEQKKKDVAPAAPPAPKTLQQVIIGDAMKHQFALALPKICTPERFVRVALTAVNKNPKLLNCTRESVLACLMGCAELGIEPDGRRAHLIPYNSKNGMICTLIIDYKGKIELAMRSGTVSMIHADKICEHDLFLFNKGEVVKHEIDFRKDRGKAFAYYCIVRMKDGTEKSEVMTTAEIDAVRKRSRASGDGPWVTDYDEMAKKTVFHRASKWITLSPELRASEEIDADQGAGAAVGPSMLEIPATVTTAEAKTEEPAAVSMADKVEGGK